MQNVKQLCFLLVLIVMGTLPMLADSPGPEDENIPPVAYNAVLSETVPAAGEELGASLVLRGTVVVPEWIEDFKLEECLAVEARDHRTGAVAPVERLAVEPLEDGRRVELVRVLLAELAQLVAPPKRLSPAG